LFVQNTIGESHITEYNSDMESILAPRDLVRNYSNTIFRHMSDYDAAKRALLKKDLRFLREDFAGDVSRTVLALQLYVEMFQESEMADKRLNDYMHSIGDTGTAVWDHATQTAICNILTEDQKKTKEPLRTACTYWKKEAREARTHLLTLMYGGPRDEDDDEDIYGDGVDEDEPM
jgi:hypothetical protein